MRDRLITLGGAVLALALCIGLFYSPPQPDAQRPTSLDETPEGYAGLAEWLRANGVPTTSLQRKVDYLDTLLSAPSGHVLISVLPLSAGYDANETDFLETWLDRGNTHLILAGLNDTPGWSLSSRDTLEQITELTGLEFEAYRVDEEAAQYGAMFEPTDIKIEPKPSHPLMVSIDQLAGRTTHITNFHSPTSSWGYILELARMQDGNAGAIWQIAHNEGDIILIANASLLSNAMLDQADNAKFFSNLLQYHLKPGGHVIFDDFHQGVSDLYDPQAFFSDARFWNSLGFVVFFWLVYILGSSARLEEVVQRAQRARQTDLTGALAGFMDRKLTPNEAARQMIDQWWQHIRRQMLLPEAQDQAWAQLAEMPLIDTSSLQAVRQIQDDLRRGKTIDLAELHNHLLHLKRNLE